MSDIKDCRWTPPTWVSPFYHALVWMMSNNTEYRSSSRKWMNNIMSLKSSLYSTWFVSETAERRIHLNRKDKYPFGKVCKIQNGRNWSPGVGGLCSGLCSCSKAPFFFPLGKNKNYPRTTEKYFWLLRCHYKTVMMSFQTVFHGISLSRTPDGRLLKHCIVKHQMR